MAHDLGDVDLTDLDTFADGFPYDIFRLHRGRASRCHLQPGDAAPAAGPAATPAVTTAGRGRGHAGRVRSRVVPGAAQPGTPETSGR